MSWGVGGVQRVVEEKVHEKVFHVTSMVEFSQIYGLRNNINEFCWAVLEAINKNNPLNRKICFCHIGGV